MYFAFITTLTVLVIGLAIFFFLSPRFKLIERKHLRHVLKKIPVTIKTIIFGEPKETTIHLTNISLAGIGFITEVDLVIDSGFAFDFEDHQIQCIVRYKLPLEKTVTPCFQCGAEFVNTDTEICKAFLNSIVKK